MDPVNRAIEAMLADQENRHAWLIEAAEQIREEDKALSNTVKGVPDAQ